MSRTNSEHNQIGNSTISAIMDAIRATPITLPQTHKVFQEIAKDLAVHQTRFNEQMKRVEEEIARGCRRTKGDIV